MKICQFSKSMFLIITYFLCLYFFMTWKKWKADLPKWQISLWSVPINFSSWTSLLSYNQLQLFDGTKSQHNVFILYDNHLDVLHHVEENICHYFHFYRDFKYWTLVCNLSHSIFAMGMNDTLDHVRLRFVSTFQSFITSIPTGYSSWSIKRWEKIDVQLATL